MAITTYAELQTAVGNWLANQVSTDSIPDFIALAEAEMSRVLFDNSAEVRAQAVTVAGTARVSLPNDCRRVRALRLDAVAGANLDYWPPTTFNQFATLGQGQPGRYTIEAGALRLSPVPDDEYTLEIIYQQGVPALSDANTSNDILARHPDAYLHGSLMQAYDFLMDEARAGKARQRFNELLIEIAAEAERTRFGATPLARRSAYREIN
ncbi:MAG: hypothetical protein WC869_11995 [Phycisphaerae bacterium]|jgi:hypothetical protein